MKNQPKWSSAEETDDIGREERRRDSDRLRRQTYRKTETHRERERGMGWNPKNKRNLVI